MSDSRDPQDDRVIHWLRESRPADEPSFDVDAAWSRFARNNDVSDVRRMRRIPVMWQAAAAVLVAVAGLGVWQLTRHTAPALVEQVAGNGQRREIRLADGSTVTLKGGSRLRYADRASNGPRDVYLDGEAFFDVHHDATHPFRVHARNGTIEDVGTRFNVRAYAPEATLEVAVAEGSVALGGTGPVLILSAGDVAVLEPSGRARRVSSASLDRYVGWMHGELVFDSRPLSAVALELERAYGRRIVIEDSALARRPVSAHLHGEDIRGALDAIVLALGATYDQRDSTFLIHAPRTSR